jgi:hypothetical protein
MTTSLQLPRPWATNVNYSSGPDTGTPTKVDPASDANGFISGSVASAAHVNYHVAQLTRAARRALALKLCKPRRLGLTSDQAGGIGVCSIGRGLPAIVGNGHSAGVPRAFDGDINLGGVVASITGAVNGAAVNGSSRIVLVGGGGNRSCFSDNGGTAWSAGGDLGGTGLDVIYNSTFSRFQAGYSGHMRYSSDATAWTDVVVAGYLGKGIGLSSVPNGRVTVVQTGVSPVTASKSANGGTSWAAAGTIANAASITAGSVGGAGLDNIYHAGVLSGGSIQISSTPDGVTWTVVNTLAPVASNNYTAALIRQCPDTGVLFLLTGLATGTVAILASLDGGATWTEQVYAPVTAAACYGVAHGRIFILNAAGELFASDGAGWE